MLLLNAVSMTANGLSHTETTKCADDVLPNKDSTRVASAEHIWKPGHRMKAKQSPIHLAKGPGWQPNFASRKQRRTKQAKPSVTESGLDNRNIFAELLSEDVSDGDSPRGNDDYPTLPVMSHLDIEAMLLNRAATRKTESVPDASDAFEFPTEESSEHVPVKHDSPKTADPSDVTEVSDTINSCVENTKVVSDLSPATSMESTRIRPDQPTTTRRATATRVPKRSSTRRVSWKDQKTTHELEEVLEIENCLDAWRWKNCIDISTHEGKVSFAAGALWYGVMVVTAFTTVMST